MSRIAVALLFLMVSGPAATAQLMMTRSCAGRNCIMTFGLYDPNSGLGKVIRVPESFDPEQEQRIAKWEKFCEPKIVLDSSGVRRYVYSKPGCEFGRAE